MCLLHAGVTETLPPQILRNPFLALGDITQEVEQEEAMSERTSNAGSARNRTSVERRGDRELVVIRVFDAPRSRVYEAWSQSELFRRWWFPKSVSGVSLVSCELDVRTGGKYRLEFAVTGAETMAFYGTYLEVVPNARMVWTNDEGEEGAITIVTFEDRDGQTLLTYHEAYPSGDGLEEALHGSAAALPEQLDQLEALLSGHAE
jgi:uncharacterized protein YndB with AHSA1/START domain